MPEMEVEESGPVPAVACSLDIISTAAWQPRSIPENPETFSLLDLFRQNGKTLLAILLEGWPLPVHRDLLQKCLWRRKALLRCSNGLCVRRRCGSAVAKSYGGQVRICKKREGKDETD